MYSQINAGQNQDTGATGLLIISFPYFVYSKPPRRQERQGCSSGLRKSCRGRHRVFLTMRECENEFFVPVYTKVEQKLQYRDRPDQYTFIRVNHGPPPRLWTRSSYCVSRRAATRSMVSPMARLGVLAPAVRPMVRGPRGSQSWETMGSSPKGLWRISWAEWISAASQMW